MLTDRLPPHDIEAEEAVIASILVDSEAIYRVAPILQPDDFFRDKNAWAYEACLALFERNEAINQVTLGHELARRDRLEEMGGLAYLSRLVAELATPVGVEHYARIVKRDAVYRRLIEVVEQDRADGVPGRAGPRRRARASRDHAALAADGRAPQRFPAPQGHPRPLLGRARARIAARRARRQRPHRLHGPGHAARRPQALRPHHPRGAAEPGQDQSGAEHRAQRRRRAERAVAIFSLEMAAEQLAQRLLASESGVDSTRLRLGLHTEAEERRVMNALGVLAAAEIYVDDSAVLRMPEIRGKALRLARDRGLDLVIIDYLQLIHGTERGDNRVQEISYISRGLKELARELDVPVIAVSQLSRAPEMRSPHIPMLSDLRESGSIEQDADVVMFIYREEIYVRKRSGRRAP